MKVIITGGGGFLGSQLCQQLLRRGSLVGPSGKPEPIREIILALGTDVEGDATSFYLAKRLSVQGVKTSRIAHGLPAGSGLEFADELTLSRAIEGRREIHGS